MKFPIYALFICLICVATSTSCKKDPVVACNSFNIATDLADENAAVIAAQQTHVMDPTPANCTAYKNAFQNYINALRDLESCARAAGAFAAYEAELNEAEANIDNLC